METHLANRIRAHVPTLVITHSLTSTASALLAKSSAAALVHHYLDASGEGTRIFVSGEELLVPGAALWDLDNFIREVLEP